MDENGWGGMSSVTRSGMRLERFLAFSTGGTVRAAQLVRD
jgi:hypothetical protein